jgi:ribose 5-phosphate isomerase B
VAQALRENQAERGIIVCGSGAGVSIAANKFPGIRAAVCHDTYTAHQAVEHDDLNVVCIGARVIGPALALEIVEAFLGASFSGEDRHLRRLEKILAIEHRFTQS